MPKRRAESEAGTSTTTAAERRAKAKAEALEELKKWIDENDTMIAKDCSISLEQLFSLKILGRERFVTNNGNTTSPCDWSKFQKAFEERSESSEERWFVQCRRDDLLLDPHGLEGLAVDNFVIVATKEPTLAPAHYIVKDHRNNADIEDNAPERVFDLEGQGVKWIPIVGKDGKGTNSFLLHRPNDVKLWGGGSAAAAVGGFNLGAAPAATAPAPAAPAAANGTAPLSFGFNTAAAAPAAAPAATESPAPTFGLAPTPSFGLGAPTSAPSPSPTIPQQAPSFGLAAPAAPRSGSPPPAASATPTFGFAAPAAPAASAAPAVDAGFAAGFGGGADGGDAPSSAVSQLKPHEIQFALWSNKRVKEMIKDLKSGTRIVKKGFAVGEGVKMKLVMQSDMKDDVAKTVHNLCLGLFAKDDEEIKAVDEWMEECPQYDEKLQEHLQQFRARFLKEQVKNSDDFDKLVAEYSPKITQELERIVKIRRDTVAAELEVLESISLLLKQGKISERDNFSVFKYHPNNDVVKFRPTGKVGGIHEGGEQADICEPAAYVAPAWRPSGSL